MKKRDKELKCVIKIEKDAKRGGERKIKMEKREREREVKNIRILRSLFPLKLVSSQH